MFRDYSYVLIGFYSLCVFLLLKVYTIDKFYKKVVTVGHAALNVFVAAGTNRQPKVDTGGVQVYSMSIGVNLIASVVLARLGNILCTS